MKKFRKLKDRLDIMMCLALVLSILIIPSATSVFAATTWQVSYLGGSTNDLGWDTAVDSAGNFYITGRTESTNFPTTADAYQPANAGATDAFVARFDSGGSLIYSTYLGGSAVDYANSIAVDGAGNIYIIGQTQSTTTDFPTTPGAYQTTYGGGSYDAFAARFDSSGGLAYSTYLGGSNTDYGLSIAVDNTANIYIAGRTISTDFPHTADAYQPANAGSTDAFVARFDAGSSLSYSTYLGGSVTDYVYDIAADNTGNFYITGRTDSTNFPTTPGAYQPASGGGTDAFVAKFNSGGNLVYGTYLGGNGAVATIEYATNIAVDSTANIYISGRTDATNFPITPDAYKTTKPGTSDTDGFVSKFNSFGNLVYSTYLGGTGTDYAYGMSVDDTENFYVTGQTASTTDFPTTTGAYQTTYGGGGFDAFFARLMTVQLPTADFTADPLSGDVLLTVQFTDQSTGLPTAWAWDFDNNGTVDSTEQNPSHIYDTAGTYTVKLTVTNAVGSDDEIKTDYITVSLPPPSITLTPESGPAGTFVTVTGNGFAASTAGIVWLDTNGDGVFNNGEPFPWATLTSIVTDASGNIPAGLILPISANVAAGTYSVQADFPSGGAIEASTTFTVTEGILLNCNSGIPGVTTLVTGGGFAASTAGTVWFDTNNNGTLDGGEPSMSVTTDTGGNIPLLTRLVIPSTGTGDYTVQADIPDGSSIEASATFTVTSSGIILSATYGNSRVGPDPTITGSGFPASTSFRVFFDRNRNGVYESGEGNRTGTTTGTGTIPASISFSWSASPAGIYNVLFDLGNNGTVDTSAGCVITPSIYITTPRGKPGTNIGMNLDGFSAYADGGYVWFDNNLNGVWDDGENKATVTKTDNKGAASSPGLIVPDLTPGPYQVCAAIPACSLKTAPAVYYVAGLILKPSSGTAGTSIAITGYMTGTNRTGTVWFDTDGDSAIDAGEPQVAATSDANGVLSPLSLTAPAVAGGTYYVCADVPTGGFVPDVKTPFILLGPPNAAFAATPTSGTSPLTVNFTDQSTGSPTQWAWDFDNDGTVDSADQYPSHSYATPGTYTVKLTVTNAYGSDDEVKTDYITVLPATLTITASAGEHGSIDPSGDVIVSYGGSQTFYISADSGYHITDVIVDGASVGAVTSYTFDNVISNHTIIASFTETVPDWDLNGDHTCDIGDVVMIGLKWGLTGDPGWIPEDLNNDGVIDIGDVVVLGLHWGQVW